MVNRASKKMIEGVLSDLRVNELEPCHTACLDTVHLSEKSPLDPAAFQGFPVFAGACLSRS